MKQRETFVRLLCDQQLLVFGSYLVQSRLAQGLTPCGLPPDASAGAGAMASSSVSATAAPVIVFRATRRSAAVLVECIDVHLRVRRAVTDASAPARHRSLSGAAAGTTSSARIGRSPGGEARTGVRVRL